MGEPSERRVCAICGAHSTSAVIECPVCGGDQWHTVGDSQPERGANGGSGRGGGDAAEPRSDGDKPRRDEED